MRRRVRRRHDLHHHDQPRSPRTRRRKAASSGARRRPSACADHRSEAPGRLVRHETTLSHQPRTGNAAAVRVHPGVRLEQRRAHQQGASRSMRRAGHRASIQVRCGYAGRSAHRSRIPTSTSCGRKCGNGLSPAPRGSRRCRRPASSLPTGRPASRPGRAARSASRRASPPERAARENRLDLRRERLHDPLGLVPVDDLADAATTLPQPLGSARN